MMKDIMPILFVCFCPPESLLAFQFDLSDGRITVAGNIVLILFAFHLNS